MDNEKVIELANNIIRNYDRDSDAEGGKLMAMLTIPNDDYTALIYGVQNNLISKRFAFDARGLFLDGKLITPVVEPD